MKEVRISVNVNVDTVTGLLEADKEIRVAMRQADAEAKDQDKRLKEAGKTSAASIKASKVPQDPPTVFKKYPKQALVSSGNRNLGDIDTGMGSRSVLVKRTGRPVSTENDDLDFQGWFGVSFALAPGVSITVGYLGIWDREGNGVNGTKYFVLTGANASNSMYKQYTISSSEFIYRSNGFRYAKLPEPVKLTGETPYLLATYYFADVYTDRYEYYIGSSFNTVGTIADSSVFQSVQEAEIYQMKIFPTSLRAFEEQSGTGLPALNINLATANYIFS